MKRLTLDEARKRKGFKTQAQLAEASGVAQGRISDIESGKIKQPEITTMDRLAKALGMVALCSVAGLVFEEKQP